jgi:hypothetical protein
MVDSGDFSVAAARRAAERDELGDWVARFLASPGSDNAALADLLAERPRWWMGPVLLPFDRLNRLAGPPGEPVLVALDDEDWGDNVEQMAENVEEGWEPPPVIVSYREGQLVLEDGNHRVEGMRRAGERETWAVVNFEDEEARDRFDEATSRVSDGAPDVDEAARRAGLPIEAPPN